VQPVERFVGRDAHEDVEALPDEPVGEVEQPRERLACALLRVGADELVTVLQHEQAPPPRVIVVVVERDAHQVAGIVQEPVGVEHAVDLAPRMPRVREGAQRRGLAGAGWTVEQQHPTAERGGLQRHHSLEPVGRGRVVVLPDRRPGVDVDRALDPSRPMAAHVPEADGGLVVTLGRRQLRVDGRGGEDLTGQRVGHRGDGHEAGVVGPPARPQRPAFAGREVRPRAPSRRGVLRDDVRRQERRVRLQPLQALRPSGRLPARDEVDQGEGIDDVAGVVGVVDRDDERGGGGVDVHMEKGVRGTAVIVRAPRQSVHADSTATVAPALRLGDRLPGERRRQCRGRPRALSRSGNVEGRTTGCPSPLRLVTGAERMQRTNPLALRVLPGRGAGASTALAAVFKAIVDASNRSPDRRARERRSWPPPHQRLCRPRSRRGRAASPA
jgi:hypothetical protein